MYKKSEKPKKFGIYIFIALLFFLFGWQVNQFVSNELSSFDQPQGDNETDDAEDYSNLFFGDNSEKADLDLFWTVWGEVEAKYVDKDQIENESMVYGAIKGMVASLNDPYTVFMTPDESQDFNASLEGTLEGIGAELSVEDQNLTIVSPLRNSPAEKAGLEPGDIILAVDDEPTYDMTLFEAIMKIRGEKGTAVKLTVIRNGLKDAFDVEIVRDSIDIESVTVEEIDDVVILSVNQFNDKTIDEFSKAISEMILDEPKGLIVDLRFNGGGYLDIAVDMLSYLLPSDKKAVIIKQRGKDDDVMYTNGNAKLLNVPVVVLINEGSASASEIVAGGIQDHERGIVMGTQSFGKGTVQEVETFLDGSSIRMTVAKWYTPDGRSINEVGITPDIIVEITDADIDSEIDAQKDRAVGYLKNL